MGLAEIARAKIAYDSGDLRPKLARWHSNVDNAFRGWNEAWLDPDFRKWDIREYLAYIRVPVQIVQGADDQYGTTRQIEVGGNRMLLPGRRHTAAWRPARAASRRARCDAYRNGRFREPPSSVSSRRPDGGRLIIYRENRPERPGFLQPNMNKNALSLHAFVDSSYLCTIVHRDQLSRGGTPHGGSRPQTVERRDLHRFPDRSLALQALENRGRRRHCHADDGCGRKRRPVRRLSAQTELL